MSVPLTPLDAWVAARVAGGVGPGRPAPARAHAAASASLDPAALRRHQTGALRSTVALARTRSPFYAERLADVDASGVRSLDDLSTLPFTTAGDVRRQGERMVCTPAGRVERIVTLPTSGTSGEPKRIQFSAPDQELTVDFFHHGMSVLTYAGDRVAILLPCDRPGGVGDLLRLGLERLGATPLPYGPVRDVAATLDAIERDAATVAVGIPVQALALARRSVLERRAIRLRSVLLSTDHVPRGVVGALERAWACRVFDHYGSTEMGLGGGVECAAHAGLHLREADLLFEIIDPSSGRPLPAGEEGEVVFTTLTREAMPLIRYRTGDAGRFLTEPCPCGSGLRLLAKVRARVDGVAVLAGGRPLSLADLDDALFDLDEVLDFRARLDGDGMGERLAVELLVQSGRGAASTTLRRASEILERLPAVAGAREAGSLTLELSAADEPWSSGDGTAKRTLRDERLEEGR